jgi:hypothetical protein
MNTRIVPIGCSVICVALLCAIAIAAYAATLTVINTNDSGPGSLRQALVDVNDGDTINFDPALNGQTINLTSAELAIDKNITISGPGPNLLTVSRSSGTFRIFHVMSGHTVIIGGLTISGGDGTPNGSGILNDHAMLTMDSCALQNNFDQYNYGGGVYNDGSGGSATLNILNSSVSGNHAYYAGGGIYNDASNGGSATLTIMNSIVSNNSAGFSDSGSVGGEGGGIYNGGGTLTITSSTVSGNGAGAPDPFPAGYGGGIYNYGTLTITNSTINSNQVWLAGGGIYNSGGTLTITSSTVSGNGASGQHDGQPWGHGGGIYGGGTITNSTLSNNYATQSGGGIDGGGAITNSTISGNSATVGGGISTGGGVIGDTILNNNSGANIDGTVTSHGYNISTDDGGGNLTGPGDQINTDPMLGPLQDNGGPTFTHALLSGSPAIDAGDPNFTPPPYYDQRGPGFWRVRNGRIDIGSFEVQAGTTPTPTPSQINLSAIGRRVQGRHTVDLSWSGANSANIDIYRNGVVIGTVPDNGSYKDFIGVRGGNARYTYKVCEAGTQTCSNDVTVRFGGPPL